jgi:hypothetical protein
VIHPQTGFCLPLMNHLVQQRVLDLRPRMPIEMATADADFSGPASLEIDRELA